MISGPIGHWLFASFAIVYARFFERGSRTVIIRFHPPIQEDGNVPTNARPTRTLRDDVSNASNPRNPLCHEAPFARTRNPLCTASEETRVHSTLSFHSLLSMNRFSHDLYLLNLYLLASLLSSNRYKICKRGVTKERLLCYTLLVQIGRENRLRAIGKSRVKFLFQSIEDIYFSTRII